jgi:hypothetical protein
MPSRFLDEPRIDWVASANLLSQLARLPLLRLGSLCPDCPPDRLEDYGVELMRKHLEYLSRFGRPVCLLADLEQCLHAASGDLLERRDYRPLLAGRQPDAEWDWELAPAGELADGRYARHRVAAFSR